MTLCKITHTRLRNVIGACPVNIQPQLRVQTRLYNIVRGDQHRYTLHKHADSKKTAEGKGGKSGNHWGNYDEQFLGVVKNDSVRWLLLLLSLLSLILSLCSDYHRLSHHGSTNYRVNNLHIANEYVSGYMMLCIRTRNVVAKAMRNMILVIEVAMKAVATAPTITEATLPGYSFELNSKAICKGPGLKVKGSWFHCAQIFPRLFRQIHCRTSFSTSNHIPFQSQLK